MIICRGHCGKRLPDENFRSKKNGTGKVRHCMDCADRKRADRRASTNIRVLDKVLPPAPRAQLEFVALPIDRIEAVIADGFFVFRIEVAALARLVETMGTHG